MLATFDGMQEMAIKEPASTLLELPDQCLVAVLRCCNNDQRCLLSAAKAHSRLHQAAVIALRSITAVKATQQQADGMLQYLEKHGQHLDSIRISGDRGCTITLPLPGHLQLNTLNSVQLDRVSLHPCLQLQPGHGLLGMLGPAAGVAALTQLRLSDCKLRDTAAADALASAFWQLPQGMQHLSIKSGTVRFRTPAGVCRQLQQLTHLELFCIDVVGPDGTSSKLQDLPSLTRLVDLQLHAVWQVDVTGDMLSPVSGMRHLTRLELPFSKSVDLSVLDGRTQLQHFALGQRVSGVQEAQVLSHLQHMQHLTYLDLSNCLWSQANGNPPAAAYSALTASSELVHLDIGYCTLPAGVWQHIFPAGRQLPHLQFLYMTCMRHPAVLDGVPPTGSTLVSCCPSLQVLDISGLQYSAELLATLHRLTELTGLSTLYLGNDDSGEGLEVVSQLTGLRELFLHFPSSTQHRLLLQLTQLKQLTSLDFEGPHDGARSKMLHLTDQAPDNEPVWRQVLRLHLDHHDLTLAEEAAAAWQSEGGDEVLQAVNKPLRCKRTAGKKGRSGRARDGKPANPNAKGPTKTRQSEGC